MKNVGGNKVLKNCLSNSFISYIYLKFVVWGTSLLLSGTLPLWGLWGVSCTLWGLWGVSCTLWGVSCTLWAPLDLPLPLLLATGAGITSLSSTSPRAGAGLGLAACCCLVGESGLPACTGKCLNCPFTQNIRERRDTFRSSFVVMSEKEKVSCIVGIKILIILQVVDSNVTFHFVLYSTTWSLYCMILTEPKTDL